MLGYVGPPPQPPEIMIFNEKCRFLTTFPKNAKIFKNVGLETAAASVQWGCFGGALGGPRGQNWGDPGAKNQLFPLWGGTPPWGGYVVDLLLGGYPWYFHTLSYVYPPLHTRGAPP